MDTRYQPGSGVGFKTGLITILIIQQSVHYLTDAFFQANVKTYKYVKHATHCEHKKKKKFKALVAETMPM